ncbi:MAG: SUMF1/EgtB/PvdO family nonheme iron enzyme, partial [Actinomycetota bacterium]|nr:SUMF1/EgtB/PvdO family nonheme iron enzyme [Actinomycetota bacterium]
ALPLEEREDLLRLVIQHELQHQETMLVTLNLSGLDYPAPPEPDIDLPKGDRLVAGGSVTAGTDDDPWAYDNERPAHAVELEPFRIDASPVSNGEYAEFLADTGTEPPLGWNADGTQTRFGRPVELARASPVRHVSWHEADAYARWAGKRLPTELEWEAARPENAGSVWEWTASDFRGYPGFRAHPYREYSEVFFGDEYRVLRGASFATDPIVARPTFRNWDFPVRKQIFSGFRCAR